MLGPARRFTLALMPPSPSSQFNSVAFRELCDEYHVCSETAARMEGAAGAKRAIRDEYVALRLRLEGELLRYMSEHDES